MLKNAPTSCSHCNNTFCQSLSEKTRKQLFKVKTWVNYNNKDDKTFFLEDHQVLILEKGAIIGYRYDMNVKIQSVDLIQPGDLLGIVSLLTSKKRESFSILSLVDSAGCMIPLLAMEKLIAEELDICAAIIRQYSHRYSRVVDSFINKITCTAEERVAFASQQLEDIGVHYITHENLGLLSGMNRVTVTKALGKIYPK